MDISTIIGESSEYDKKQSLEKKRPKSWCKSVSALVNALIHRNYFELGSEVHIDMFDDRLEIYSPGGMIDGSTLEGKDLMSIPSRRRNPVLADIFSRLNFMERRGSGFKKILGAYGESQKKPEFKTDFGNFLIVFPNENYGNAELVTQADQVHDTINDTINDRINDRINLSEKERIVYEEIKREPAITVPKLIESTGFSEPTINRALKSLRENGFLIRIGARKNGHWEVQDGK